MDPLNPIQKEILAQCQKYGIETNCTKRWEQGIPHHPKSEAMMEDLMNADWLFSDDYFCWKKGGDGDNGETLMFALDIMFELKDKQATESKL